MQTHVRSNLSCRRIKHADQLQTGLVRYMILKLHGNETRSSFDQTRGYFFLSALCASFSIDKRKISSGPQGKNKLINLVTRAAKLLYVTVPLNCRQSVWTIARLSFCVSDLLISENTIKFSWRVNYKNSNIVSRISWVLGFRKLTNKLYITSNKSILSVHNHWA